MVRKPRKPPATPKRKSSPRQGRGRQGAERPADTTPDQCPPAFPPMPELPHDEVKDHILKLELREFAEPLFFPVLRDTWSRVLGAIQQARRDSYIGFNTADGRAVYVNCAHLLTCHFLWEPSFFGARVFYEEERETMRFHLRGRSKPVEIRDMEEEHIAGGLMLDTFGDLDERFLTLMDEDGEPIAINLDALVYVEYPVEWEEERSEDDPPEEC